MCVRWDPVREAERREDLEVVDEHLPASTGGGLYVRFGDGHGVIALDPGLHGVERRDVLAHELVHHERRGGAGGHHRCVLWSAVRAREEGRVHAIVASRLVPLDELAAFCDRMADLGEGVGPDEVMDEFDCTRRVAIDALDNLTRHERGTA